MAIDFNKIGLGGGKNYTFTSPDNTIDINEVDDEVQLQVNKQVAFTLPVSSDPAIDNAKYNDFGLLTDDVTITYPASDPGEVKIFYGQFQTDLDNLYTVDFGNDVILTGDTEMHPYSIYLFQIVGNFVLLKEIRFGGLKNKVIGKVVNGFSGDHVVISVNGTNTNVSVGSDGWFFYDVAPSVTRVKFNTADKTNFEKIYIADLNSLTDMSYMFDGCSNLISLDVSNLNTANVTNMQMTFRYLTLTSLDVSNFNTANVTNMSNMFQYCSNLTSLDVSNFNTANSTNFYLMFSDCSKLTSLDVSNFNTAKATSMQDMFRNCSKLTSLDVSNFNTANVTNIESMFYNCSSLTSLDVSNFNTANVTTMFQTFYLMSNLLSLDVSNFDTANVTTMRGMFQSCNKLTNLDVSNFNTANVTTMQRMFNSCSKLTSLDVSNFNTANVTNMQNMFAYCSILTDINMDNIILSNNVNVTDLLKNDANLQTIYLRNSDTTTYDKINAVKPAGATIVTAA